MTGCWLANATPELDSYEKASKAFIALVKALVEIFGPLGAIGIMVGCVILWWGFLAYQHWRKDKETNQTIKALNEQIQRLADQDRSNRMLIMMDLHGKSFDEAEMLIIGGGRDAKETRDILGRSKKKDSGKKQSSAKPKDSKKKE